MTHKRKISVLDDSLDTELNVRSYKKSNYHYVSPFANCVSPTIKKNDPVDIHRNLLETKVKPFIDLLVDQSQYLYYAHMGWGNYRMMIKTRVFLRIFESFEFCEELQKFEQKCGQSVLFFLNDSFRLKLYTFIRIYHLIEWHTKSISYVGRHRYKTFTFFETMKRELNKLKLLFQQ